MKNYFTNGLVAFIDILGFTEKFKANKNNERRRLLDLLTWVSTEYEGDFSDIKKIDGSYQVRPEAICVSDCVIISIPTDCDDDALDRRIQTFTLALVTIAFEFLSRGYLVRGAVDYGEVFHKKNIITGLAYINAVEHEKKRAIEPRIIYTENVFNFIEKFSRRQGYTKGSIVSYMKSKRSEKDTYYLIDELRYFRVSRKNFNQSTFNDKVKSIYKNVISEMKEIMNEIDSLQDEMSHKNDDVTIKENLKKRLELKENIYKKIEWKYEHLKSYLKEYDDEIA